MFRGVEVDCARFYLDTVFTSNGKRRSGARSGRPGSGVHEQQTPVRVLARLMRVPDDLRPDRESLFIQA